MYELHQVTILDVKSKEDFKFLFDNFRNPKLGGWTQAQVDELEKTGKMQRQGAISGGMELRETIEIKEKFKLVGI